MNSIDNLLTRLDSVLTAEHMVVFLLISVVFVYLLGKWMNER
jgi:hypothetical protein